MDLDEGEKIEKLNDLIGQRIANKYGIVGDLSSHPITEEMDRIRVGVGRISWVEPKGEGYRNSLIYDKVANQE